MFRKSSSSRCALWVFVAALLLKAAMPLLASASAQAQGRELVQVCTLYGVALMPLQTSGSEPSPDPAGAHAEHCALNVVSALAPLQPALRAFAPALARATERSIALAAPHAVDACAAWLAGLKRGPPIAT